MSRGYYGIIYDNLYEIVKDRYEPRTIIGPKKDSVMVRQYPNASIDVNMHFGNVTEDPLSNKEMVEYAINKISTENIKSIESLGEACKMVVYYKLLFGTPDCPIVPTGKRSEIADEGCMMSEVSLCPAFYPLGLNDDNEYVTRWVLTTGSTKFTRNYVQSNPIGVTRHRNSQYTLSIDRIQIIQYKYSENAYPDPHPSIEHYNNMIYPSSDNSVTIFDTEVEGLKIDPISIPIAPNQITLHIEVDMNSYFVTADRSDITYYLDKNIEAEKVEENDPPIESGDDKEDIGSETGGNKDNPPSGEDSGTTGSEGTDTPSTDTPSEDNPSDSGSEEGEGTDTPPTSEEGGKEEPPTSGESENPSESTTESEVASESTTESEESTSESSESEVSESETSESDSESV